MIAASVVSIRVRRMLHRLGQSVAIATSLCAAGLWVFRPHLPAAWSSHAQHWRDVFLKETVGKSANHTDHIAAPASVLPALLQTFGVPLAKPVTVLQTPVPTHQVPPA
ncbi:MAG: hypothetical protein K6T83_21450, partial [Alicyclobacillus sp.]|nr:hypothetical protein [Alicyclobacillus sp.]